MIIKSPTLDLVVAKLVIFISFFYPINGLIPNLIVIKFALFFLWIFVLSIKNPAYLSEIKVQIQRHLYPVILLLIILLVIILNILIRPSGTRVDILIFLGFMAIIPISSIVIFYRNTDSGRSLLSLGIIVIGAAISFSIPYIVEYPGSIRWANSSDSSTHMTPYFIGSWLQLMAVGIILPFILGQLFLCKGWQRIQMIVIVILVVYALIMSTLASTQIITLFTFIMIFPYFIHSIKKRNTVKLIGVLLLVIIILNFFINQNPLQSETFLITSGKSKSLITQISQSGLKGDFTGRGGYLLARTIEQIKDRPILGASIGSKSSMNSGGHLHWLDFFAWFGLIGGVPLLLLFVHIGRKLWNTFLADKNIFTYSVLMTYFVFIVAGIIGGIFFDYLMGVTFFFIVQTHKELNYVSSESE